MVTTTPVTIEQAAALLGVSASTVRRRIRAGTLQVTETRRPQGVVWLVHLPPGVSPAVETATVDTAPVTTTAAMSPALTAWVTSVLEPLVAELGTSRQRIEDLARENGRLGAELERTRAEIHALTASAASETAQSTPRSPGTFLRAWARLDWLVVALVAAAAVAGVLLAWPR
jgi:excisionase family DNA binding protein